MLDTILIGRSNTNRFRQIQSEVRETRHLSAAYVVLALMMPLEQIANEYWLPLVAQVVLLGYFLSYFVISLGRVYHESWIIATVKSIAILIAYLVVFSGAIAASSNLQILSD